MDRILEQIKNFADQAHGDQQRKYSPERYIAHPVRVMQTCRKYSSKLPVLAAALLHDVVEDTEVGSRELEEYLSSVLSKEDVAHTMKLVIELTDVYTKEAYPRLNRKRRKAKESERLETTSGDAQTIKYADIMDNCRAIGKSDNDFALVFLKECSELLNKMTKGKKELWDEARTIVDEELGKLHQTGVSRGK
ncbi:MAG TPA: HD domain-containing protein [Chitinophagaceae bacterium]